MLQMKKELVLSLCLVLGGMTVFAAETEKKSLLPDYSQKVGFTYSVGADLVSNYIWRGLYVGGLGIQADASVGYGGAFIDMWWNVGATDWSLGANAKGLPNAARAALNPEVDMTIGFSRWGLTVMFMHMYYFDQYKDGTNSKYFDFGNHGRGEGGITQEWRVKYRVSDALPISILWCTRTWGRDGYYVPIYNSLDIPVGLELKRAYSSYLELGYDFYFQHNLSLEARLGMTPWKSMYTGFQGDFAVCNLSAKLNWHKDISERCMMTAFANLMLNPYDMATNYSINGPGNPFLWNVGCGFYLK